jgi:hypothetical protein
MSLLTLIGWSFATGMLAMLGFMVAAFAGAGVQNPKYPELWKVVTSGFGPIFLLMIPAAVMLALILHFTRWVDYAQWPLVLAGALAAGYPAVIVLLARSR